MGARQSQPAPQPPAAGPTGPTLAVAGPVAFEEARECHACGLAFTAFDRRHHFTAEK